MLNSLSLSPRQILQGMSIEVSMLRKRLIELALYDTPLMCNNHYTEAMKLLQDASLELSQLRVPASPDPLAILSRDLPELDTIINRI